MHAYSLPVPPASLGKLVRAPNGTLISRAELPSRDTVRWVMSRKAIVVAAVQQGLLSLQEACERYRLSEEEFLSWKMAIEKHGLLGLRVTHIQDYRKSPIIGAHEKA